MSNRRKTWLLPASKFQAPLPTKQLRETPARRWQQSKFEAHSLQQVQAQRKDKIYASP
jgi:hypothetical protein